LFAKQRFHRDFGRSMLLGEQYLQCSLDLDAYDEHGRGRIQGGAQDVAQLAQAVSPAECLIGNWADRPKATAWLRVCYS